MSNIFNTFKEYTDFFGDSTAVYFPKQEIAFTGKDLATKVDNFANGLKNMGISSGASIGIALSNTAEWLISFFAAQKIGAEVVLLPPSNQRAANPLLKNIITNDLFNISCFIVDDEKFANTLNEYGKSFQIILREGSVKGAMSFKEVCGKGRSSIADVSIEPSENCTPIIFPIIIDDKLMPLSFPNENIYKRGQEIGAKIGLNESDKMLIPFPLYLDCGVTASVVSALSHLTPMYIIPPCSPDVIADYIYAYGITCLNSNECWTKGIFSNDQQLPLDSWQKGIISASGYPDSGISNIGPNLAVGTGSHGIICCINGNFLPGIDQDVLGVNTSKDYCGKQKNLAKGKKE